MESIRKIWIGPDIKNAFAFSVDQSVKVRTSDGKFRFPTIEHILEEEDGYAIYLNDEGETKLWKFYNKNLPITLESDIEFNEST